MFHDTVYFITSGCGLPKWTHHALRNILHDAARRQLDRLNQDDMVPAMLASNDLIEHYNYYALLANCGRLVDLKISWSPGPVVAMRLTTVTFSCNAGLMIAAQRPNGPVNYYTLDPATQNDGRTYKKGCFMMNMESEPRLQEVTITLHPYRVHDFIQPVNDIVDQ